jgi:hypothetical protein
MNVSDDKLDEALAKLPASIEPAHDLWPGIATRITPHQTRHWSDNAWSQVSAVAAVVIVAVSITWVTFGGRTPGSDNPAIATTVPTTHFTPDQDQGSRILFAAQLASDHNLPPKARQALLQNLQLLEDSIRRTQLELKKYPGDVNLQALLFNLYQQEARLMNEAQRAQIQTTVRNTI